MLIKRVDTVAKRIYFMNPYAEGGLLTTKKECVSLSFKEFETLVKNLPGTGAYLETSKYDGIIRN